MPLVAFMITPLSATKSIILFQSSFLAYFPSYVAFRGGSAFHPDPPPPPILSYHTFLLSFSRLQLSRGALIEE